MQTLRTLVVDDEPEAREGLVRLLRGDPEIEIVGECDSGRSAVTAIGALSPDVVLLDIQMPELNGFDVLAEVSPASMPVVVFVTAYDAYALRAFEAHALDYLLKPFSDERFAAAMRQAKQYVQQRRIGELGQKFAALLHGNPLGASSPLVERAPGADSGEPEATAPGEQAPTKAEYLERIVVRHERDVSFVRVAEIDWIGAADYYAKLYVGPRTHLIRETMQQLEARLDPRQFVRIHRSAIVNVDRVKLIRPYFRGGHVVVLHDGRKLVMSRGRREALERALGQPI